MISQMLYDVMHINVSKAYDCM